MRKGRWIEALVTVAARQDRLSSRDRGDTQRIPPGGTPGYTVATIRGGVTLLENVDLTLAVENFTDEDPPYVPAISTNTSPIYDPLGRFYSLRLKWSM